MSDFRPPRSAAPRSARSGQAAVTRLAWIFGDRAVLMLLRQPLLAAAVRRRHPVMALAPGLTEADQAVLTAQGIDSTPLDFAAARFNPFGTLAARRRLALTLLGWRANAVLIEDGERLTLATHAAVKAGVNSIFPILPSLEGGTAPRSPARAKHHANVSWRPALRSATACFAATPNDVRLLAGPLAKLAVPQHLLPVTCHDLSELQEQPLPPLDNGFIFLGINDGETARCDAGFARAVAAFDTRNSTRNSRVRFQTMDVRPTLARELPAHLESLMLDRDVAKSLRERVRAAHCVVVDDAGPYHTLLLTTALALGRPVLAIDHASHRHFVDAGVNGWMVPQDDDAAMGAGIAATLKRPDLLAGMARAARQKAERHLDQRASIDVLFGALGLADLRTAAALTA